jgi:DNA mismatch repair protein MSH4
VALGIDIAKLADLPDDVLVEAQRVATRLSDLHERERGASSSQQLAERRKVLLRASLPHAISAMMLNFHLLSCQGHAELTQLLAHSELPDSELENLLKSIQHEMFLKIAKTLD